VLDLIVAKHAAVGLEIRRIVEPTLTVVLFWNAPARAFEAAARRLKLLECTASLVQAFAPRRERHHEHVSAVENHHPRDAVVELEGSIAGDPLELDLKRLKDVRASREPEKVSRGFVQVCRHIGIHRGSPGPPVVPD
jgi:hypothetical protein